MYVEDKLKLNKFEYVSIPNNSELWRRSGCLRAVPSASLYSGEESLPIGERKTDVYNHANRDELNQIRREAAEARNAAQEEE